MRKHLVAPIVCASLIAAALFGPGAEAAPVGRPARRPASTASCSSTPGNWFAGYSVDAPGPRPPEGTTAYLVIRDPGMCTSVSYPYNFSVAWTMLADGAQYYAQSGFMKRTWNNGAVTCLDHFAEYTPGPNGAPFRRVFLHDLGYQDCMQSSGETHRYWQIYNAGAHRVEMWVDDSMWAYTDFDPKVSYWAPPWESHLYAETIYAEDDVPGTAGWGDMYTQIAVVDPATHAWSNPACPPWGHLEDVARYHAWISSDCKTMATWTDPL